MNDPVGPPAAHAVQPATHPDTPFVVAGRVATPTQGARTYLAAFQYVAIRALGFIALLVLLAIGWLIVGVVSTMQMLVAFAGTAPGGDGTGTASYLLAAFGVMLGVVFGLAVLVTFPLFLVMFADAIRGVQRGVGQQFSAAMGRFFPMLGAWVLVFLTTFALQLGPTFLSALLGADSIAGLIVSMVMVFVTLYVTVRLTPTLGYVVTHRAGPVEAITTAWTMTKGRLLPMFSFLFVTSLVLVVGSLAMVLCVALFAGIAYTALGTQLDGLPGIIAGSAVLVPLALFYPLALTFSAGLPVATAFYLDACAATEPNPGG